MQVVTPTDAEYKAFMGEEALVRRLTRAAEDLEIALLAYVPPTRHDVYRPAVRASLGICIANTLEYLRRA
jgi:hypothetical protein